MGEVCSGDLVFVDEIVGSVFLAIVDVAGHGREAAVLAEEIRVLIGSMLAKPLEDIAKSLHQELTATRGGVIGLARYHKESMKLETVIIGNISIRVFGAECYSILGRDGVLGFIMPTPHLVTTQLTKGDVLLMSSDGVSSHFDLKDYKHLLEDSVNEIASNVISDFSKDDDDACCIVLKVGEK